ncbi:hypothetical protein H9Q74_004624 [Fusarium xylarioides]|nr:hypothetical protein H9Q71_004399 [Fusarium xylarioides]KAG5825300.1 hypothetical protein H9Q74_004624 [Fusarium xylarioides]
MEDGDKVSISHKEMQVTPEPNVSPFVEEEPAGAYQVRWKTLMAVFALSMANCCAAIANTTNTIIHFQVMDLGGASKQAWISNANLLVTLAFGPVLGSLSDRFGKKWFIVIASVIGIVGSVVSGSAKSITTIIIGNILTGLTNAGCIMGVPAGQEVTPNKLRPWTMGFSQTLASCAVIAGTLGAGAFVKYQTWRWSYYLNAFVYGTTTVLCNLLLPSSTHYPAPTAVPPGRPLRPSRLLRNNALCGVHRVYNDRIDLGRKHIPMEFQPGSRILGNWLRWSSCLWTIVLNPKC